MSQLLVFTLLALALVVPVLGTLALRFLLGERLTDTQIISSAAALFGIAIISVLVLAYSNVDSLRVGNLTLLLPLAGPASDIEPQPAVPAASPLPSPGVATALPTVPGATAQPLTTPEITAMPTGTATLTSEPSPTASQTPEPTATAEPPSPTPEPAPPEEPAPPPEEPSAPRTYTVESGDTLRGIANQFGVTVEDILQANNLTPEEGDALQVGQELIIP